MRSADTHKTRPAKRPPPNYFARSVQTKILLLVFLFMTVLMLMSEARKPENYRWLWSLGKNPSATETMDPAGNRPVRESKSTTAMTAGPSSLDGSEADSAHLLGNSAPEKADSPPRHLDDLTLKNIKDDRVLRPEEYDAWFQLWELLRSQSATEKKIPTPDHPTYTQLFAQPNVYRGKWVTVSGRAKMAYYSAAAPNPLDIAGYYVFWVQVDDDLISTPGAGSSIVAIYCLDLPNGFPKIADRNATQQTTQLDEPMQFTGVFFKRWVYLSNGGPELTPLLLAKVTRWQPSTPSPSPTVEKSPATGAAMTILVLAAALIGVTIATWVYRKSRWTRSDMASGSAAPNTLPAFAKNHVRAGIRESLRDFNENDA